MKKMKFWSIVLLMAVSMPLLISCGGDSDDEANPSEASIVGTWVMYADNINIINNRKYIFGADGKFERYITRPSGELFGHISGTYTVAGNILTIKYGEDGSQKNQTFVFRIDGNKLILKHPNDSDTRSETYIKQ